MRTQAWEAQAQTLDNLECRRACNTSQVPMVLLVRQGL